MKKLIIKTTLTVVTFTVVLIACKQDVFFNVDENKKTNKAAVEEAITWFESNQPEFLVLKSGHKKKKTKVIKPLWRGAFVDENQITEVVETHIETNGSFGFATDSAFEKWEATGNAGYMTSVTRLIVKKDKKTNERVSFLMTIVGDKNYLEQNKFKMRGNTYMHKNDNFNGLVFYHNLMGKFVNGWRFTNGKPSHTIDIDFDRDLSIQLKSGGFYDCSEYPVYGWFQDCTDYYTVGEVGGQITSINYTGTSCGTPYMDYQGSCIECTYVPGGGSGGSNGGTGGVSSYSHKKAPPQSIGFDITDRLDCLQNVAGTNSKMTIYVDQPVANSSVPYANDNGIEVGHSFVALETIDSEGELIRQVFGFYPEKEVGPLYNPSEPGEVVLDDGHSYDVSISINISNTILSSMLIYASMKDQGTYNLNSYNCTDFVIELGNMAGLNIPDCDGDWPGGGGSNPGALGEYFRTLNDTSNIVINKYGGYAPSGSGPCGE